MYTAFKIKTIDSWADMEISAGSNSYEFSASKVFSDDFFIEFLQAIINFRNTGNLNHVKVYMEADGILHILFLPYPEDLLKLEIYHDTNWDNYTDEFDNIALPIPVFSTITTPRIAYEIVKALDNYKASDFGSFNYPAEEVTALKKWMGR